MSQAILSANQAWAYALLGDVRQALDKISLAPEQFADASGCSVPSWSAFFTANDMAAMIGTVRTELARLVDVHHWRARGIVCVRCRNAYGSGFSISMPGVCSTGSPHFASARERRGNGRRNDRINSPGVSSRA